MAILKEDYDFAKAELAKLKKKYPILGKEIKPLAVRVRDQIRDFDLGYTPEQLKNILEVHANTNSYHMSVLSSTYRYNFDGTLSFKLKKKHKLHSLHRLKVKMKRETDSKKKQLVLEVINNWKWSE